MAVVLLAVSFLARSAESRGPENTKLAGLDDIDR
jgi:hypothetical protein